MTYSLVRRRFVTLIELLIVIAILTAILGVVGINITGAVRTERFRGSVKVLTDRLQLAQDIMLIVRADVRVTLERKNDGLHVSLNVDGALTPALDRATKDTMIVSGIRAFRFTNSDGESFDNTAVLDFYSGGSRMPRGELLLAEESLNANDAFQEVILLLGRPQAIKASHPEDGDNLGQDNLQEQSRSLYPQEVTEEAQKRYEKKETRPTS